MEPILQQLDALHDATVSSILDNIHKNSPALHHYTSLQSTLDIIQNNTLRFTNMLYLNDPTEVQHGLEIGESVMMRLIQGYSSLGEQTCADILGVVLLQLAVGFAPFSKRQEKAEDLRGKLAIYISETALNTLKPILNGDEWSLYVSCLSEKSDDLRQWLPYGDNAHGAALAFKPMTDNRHSLTKSPKNKIFIISVSYADDSRKAEYLSQFLKSALAIYKANAGGINQSEYISKLVQLLIGDLVACKSPHYSDEKEWRLFFMQSTIDMLVDEPDPSFYVKGGLLRPYYDIELAKDAFPSRNQK
jgi:hypothetical protein